MRQGCPLFSLLFAIYLEPLAQRIRESDVRGFVWQNLEHKNTLYADDIILSLWDTTGQWVQVVEVSWLFSEFSGYKLNLRKTQAFIISPTNGQGGHLMWLSKNIKYLGVQLALIFEEALD